jgi:hypothetical protein
MKASIEVVDNVILRCFKGDVYLDDIIDSWEETFTRFEDLMNYKGIVTDFLDADLFHEDNNMNILMDYLKGHIERLNDMKIAVVMDSPHVTNTIMLGQKMKHLQIRPFTTRKAALDWINV